VSKSKNKRDRSQEGEVVKPKNATSDSRATRRLYVDQKLAPLDENVLRRTVDQFHANDRVRITWKLRDQPSRQNSYATVLGVNINTGSVKMFFDDATDTTKVYTYPAPHIVYFDVQFVDPESNQFIRSLDCSKPMELDKVRLFFVDSDSDSPAPKGPAEDRA